MVSVVSVNISEKKGTVKNSVDRVRLIQNHGIEHDAHSGNWHRQISLLAIESIDKMQKNGNMNLEPGVFAENITTKGIELHKLPIGAKLKISDTVLEITQIGKECHGGCEIKKKVGHCVMPYEGVFAKVEKGGTINCGDIIEIIL